MVQDFDTLSRLRANLTVIAERDMVLDRMVAIATYDQLARLLPRVAGTTRRAQVLNTMIPLGNYDQLATLRANLTVTAERDMVLDRMVAIATYDQLTRLLPCVAGTTRRAKILNAMLSYSSEKPSLATAKEFQNVKLAQSTKSSKLPSKRFDVFIAHAYEDKRFVAPLALSLQQKGLQVWYDDFVLRLGDSLRREIDKGLAQSRYGVVVLSHNFFAKHWPQKELDGLTAREAVGRKIILPIWHNIDKEDIIAYSPTLADIVAVKSSLGIQTVTQSLIDVVYS